MTRSFAADTSVTIERSLAEIERLARVHGANQFIAGWDQQGHRLVMFRLADRAIRFVTPQPDRKARRFTHTPTGKVRTAVQIQTEWEQACKARYRALLLVIKAKFESVAAGIETVEHAFLAQTVLPGGDTVGEWSDAAIPQALQGRPVPSLLMLPAKGEQSP